MESFSFHKNGTLIQQLRDLAMDLHWSWNHATDKIWRQLDPVLWELTHNPLVVLQTVSQDRINVILDDPIVRELIEELAEAKNQRSISPAWFQHAFPNTALTGIAYFSMEYMLSEALPIYSGGLGNVSGDLLKAASDLGIPVTGIGLLYQQGYQRQVLYPDGSQQYVAPFNDPGQLPVTPLRHENGEWLRIQIELPGYTLWLRAWKVQVGRSLLFLLDSNDAANYPLHRGITNELYGGDSELRLLQELILGIGGWKLLKMLNKVPEVCHMNEGHSAFVILERAADFMEVNNVSFDVALQAIKGGNIFTTHTAVGVGFDLFPPAVIEKYLGHYISTRLKISLGDFMAMGRNAEADENESFNTAYFAIRGSSYVNAVSRLHANVSRKMFSCIFPRWPVDEVPVGFVTNGVHMSTWDSIDADRLWTEACGKERWLGSLEGLEKNIASLPDSRFWLLRETKIRDFIEQLRVRYSRQLTTMGTAPDRIKQVSGIFDPSILTLGFAKRFVSYKRPNLLLYDPKRLKEILLNPDHPLQLVIAGKAHAKDQRCQEMIKEWIWFIRDHHLEHRVVFLSDYDMLLTEHMVQGVDLWLNTPRRPWEACGTSGMKVLVNGGLNISELDGWWDEAYSEDVGWTFGDREEITNDPEHDRRDAERLYELLEKEIVPSFYSRNQDGIPGKWVAKMRNSMSRLTGRFSSIRSLQEYTQNYYLPAARLFQERASDSAKASSRLLEWRCSFSKKWECVHFGDVDIESADNWHSFTVPVYLNGIDPKEVCVEIYANSDAHKSTIMQKMKILQAAEDPGGKYLYTTKVPADRPASDFTSRITAVIPMLSTSLDSLFIRWQK